VGGMVKEKPVRSRDKPLAFVCDETIKQIANLSRQQRGERITLDASTVEYIATELLKKRKEEYALRVKFARVVMQFIGGI